MTEPSATEIDAVFGGAHVVTANPPYVVAPADKRDAYRKRYVSAYSKFGLGAPFTERLFQLAVPGGYVGQITSNAFMKREYGRPLIEQALSRLDLTHVIDTSGAFIPGHGTPTVIMFGRNRPPTKAPVRVVAGKRGEPETPKGALPPAEGLLKVLAKPRKALAEDLRRCHSIGRDEAMRALGGWMLTGLMARALEERRLLTDPLPWDEGLEAVFDAVRCAAPETAWFDADPAVSHNPRHAFPPSPETERELIAVIRSLQSADRGDAFGRSGWASPDTDWIGDLHQAFDETTVKRFAFCQTPRFVRELILRYTLQPAITEFGIDGLRVLDPACGAGHFLVDAFWRVYREHADPPNGPPEVTYVRAAELALDAVRGVDLNPAVVALARFRLMLAYCDATMPRTIASAPDDLGMHVIVADALLAGEPRPSPPMFEEPAPVRILPMGQLALFGDAA